MKKYRVIASSISYYTLEIEAENDDEAWDIAHEADGSDFDPEGIDSGDWEIYSVGEITE
jgi:hypothetical protein